MPFYPQKTSKFYPAVVRFSTDNRIWANKVVWWGYKQQSMAIFGLG